MSVSPSRFAPEAVAARNTFSYLPFGAGPHNCIGMRLAQQEIKTVMAVIIRRFRFVPCPETQVGAFDLTDLVLAQQTICSTPSLVKNYVSQFPFHLV